jgi:hypothetical protein
MESDSKEAEPIFFQQHLGLQKIAPLQTAAFSSLESFQQKAHSAMPDLAMEAGWQVFQRIESRDFCLTLTPLNGENSYLAWLQENAASENGRLLYLEWNTLDPPGAFFQLYTPNGMFLHYSTLSGLEGSGYGEKGSSVVCSCCNTHGGKPSMRAIFLEDWSTLGAGNVGTLTRLKNGLPIVMFLAVHAYWCSI